VEELPSPPLKVGSSFEVQATVFLGSLDPGKVQVALYYGPLDPRGKIKEGQKVLLAYKQDLGEGRHLYQGEVLCRRGGRQGYVLLLYPWQERWQRYLSGHLLWG